MYISTPTVYSFSFPVYEDTFIEKHARARRVTSRCLVNMPEGDFSKVRCRDGEEGERENKRHQETSAISLQSITITCLAPMESAPFQRLFLSFSLSPSLYYARMTWMYISIYALFLILIFYTIYKLEIYMLLSRVIT